MIVAVKAANPEIKMEPISANYSKVIAV